MGLKLEKVILLIIIASCLTFATLANEKETFSQGALVNETLEEEEADIGQHSFQPRDNFRFLTGFSGGRIVGRLGGGSGGGGGGGVRGAGGGGGGSGGGGGVKAAGGGGGNSGGGGGRSSGGGGGGGRSSSGGGGGGGKAAGGGGTGSGGGKGGVGGQGTSSGGEGSKGSNGDQPDSDLPVSAATTVLFLPVTTLIALTSIHLILLHLL